MKSNVTASPLNINRVYTHDPVHAEAQFYNINSTGPKLNSNDFANHQASNPATRGQAISLATRCH